MAMVSVNERARLARQFDRINENVQRQKESITRLSLVMMEAYAALLEIGDMKAQTFDVRDARDRAQAAIARIVRIRESDVSGVTPLVLTPAEREVAHKALGQFAGEYATTDEEPIIDGLVSRLSAATAPDQEESTGNEEPTPSEELQHDVADRSD